MRMRIWGVIMGCCMAMVSGAMAQGLSAGVRLWNADLEVGDNSWGSNPMIIGYLGLHDGSLSLVGQAGYGSGWDNDATRTDFAVAATKRLEELTFGVGGRLIDLSAGEDSAWSSEESLTYYGPEILLGYQHAFPNTSIIVTAAGSLGAYAWDYEGDWGSDDGTSTGYSVDLGLGYALSSSTLRVGYRHQELMESDQLKGETFSGPYVDFGFLF